MENNYLPGEAKTLKEIGVKIKIYRTKTGISQEDLASKADLDRAFVGRVERGEINISVLKLKRISDALGIKLSDLVKLNSK